ncbi:hypothetical protein HBI18_246140 [Parastagonospora nodorum]|nr:hypothetical protein HBH97_248090 [Parastagonospora nodorum]KAH4914565.1 hypothetical protein HBH73_246540 [Parastagonospora nodorum]KAH5703687.1 hypothetical protein HBI20_244960 [Parastagonospora nodorum]KAH5707869.1 hypothetical protein HBI18_246140 [Parastagonospora nodorum]KAH6444783.1 hypothetical protein HBI57_238980 [Parastagonospora nodorum]
MSRPEYRSVSRAKLWLNFNLSPPSCDVYICNNGTSHSITSPSGSPPRRSRRYEHDRRRPKEETPEESETEEGSRETALRRSNARAVRQHEPSRHIARNAPQLQSKESEVTAANENGAGSRHGYQKMPSTTVSQLSSNQSTDPSDLSVQELKRLLGEKTEEKRSTTNILSPFSALSLNYHVYYSFKLPRSSTLMYKAVQSSRL